MCQHQPQCPPVDNPARQLAGAMRQVQERRRPRSTRPTELDLCTPSGRPLPF